jgi:hypothetical protein
MDFLKFLEYLNIYGALKISGIFSNFRIFLECAEILVIFLEFS